MKIKELAELLREKNQDLALFYNPEKANPNMQYFSGYTGLGILAITKNSDSFLIAPQMEFERAKNSMISKVYSMEKKRFFESAKEIIRKKTKKHGKIAIDNNNFTLNSYKSFKKSFKNSKTLDISGECAKLRTIKTPKEIGYLRKSCGHADVILQKTIKNFKEFRTESDVAAFLDYETRRNGLELSFEPIVASGKHGSMPHYKPENVKLNKGLCVIDFGVKYRGYCSDMTRTVSIGKPSAKEKEIYNFLLKIQESSIDMVKDGVKCSDLYNFVVEQLGKYGKYFTHGLGHGVGVEIHEMPNLSIKSEDRIQDDMVFTIEPGVYFPGKFGIRIEDTILFRKKTDVLTNTTKELVVV